MVAHLHVVVFDADDELGVDEVALVAAQKAVLRQLFFYIPALLLLPRALDVLGIQMAGPLTDLLTFCLALPMVLRYFKTKC